MPEEIFYLLIGSCIVGGLLARPGRYAQDWPASKQPPYTARNRRILERESGWTKTQITVELTKEVLRNTLKGPQHEITVEGIQKTICDFYNIKLGDLKAKRRTKNIAIPRQVAKNN